MSAIGAKHFFPPLLKKSAASRSLWASVNPVGQLMRGTISGPTERREREREREELTDFLYPNLKLQYIVQAVNIREGRRRVSARVRQLMSVL